MSERMARCVLLGLAAAAGVALAGDMPPNVAHRRQVAQTLDDAARFESALPDALKDADPMVRRYALNALYEKNPKCALDGRDVRPDAGVAILEVNW